MQKNIPYLVALLLIANTAFAQQKRAVEFIGGARSFMANNEISVQDSVADTTTVKKNTGGYALIDLGVNIKPNKNVEILGMFRIQNNFGGFWGSGVTFSVRQLWLKGVVGDVLRYQIGDLNLKQTPFTLYNHNADRVDSMPAIFNLQNQIVQYEKFYQKNTWRQQGVNLDFGFKFSKYLKELDFSGYTTRLQATDFGLLPDKLMSGVSVSLSQSKHLKVGFNGFYVYDLKGTVADTSSYKNTVQTLNAGYANDIKNLHIEAKAEAGKGEVYTTRDFKASYLGDYFIHAYAKIGLIKQNVSLTGGYLEVGPDFRSIGAQSKNVNYAAIPNFYNRYTNKQTNRPLSVLDMIRNDNLYNASVSTSLPVINPVYNNVLPFGIATFNRAGFFGKINYQSPKGITVNAEHYSLSEIRGQGTFQLKQFTQNKLITEFELNKLANFSRLFKVQLGANYQTTNRNSSFEGEKVALTSMQYHAGLEFEVLPKIDILGGIMAIETKGNDFLADRNQYSTVDYFSNQSYDLSQQLIAAGARCRFNEKIYLCAMYQMSKYDDKLKNNPSYTTNQFSIIYNMLF
ncbi:MAG: hypothetical protein RI894_1272 [Bacteroidota bacterium]|jgi:hypothetical protein